MALPDGSRKQRLLDQIHSPSDVRKLSMDELGSLAKEMRERIFSAVSKNGGHLASNLGVVELTLALHYVYDFGAYPAGPDRLLFDVGHQCYPHKMLTGRAGQFDTLRKKGFGQRFPVSRGKPVRSVLRRSRRHRHQHRDRHGPGRSGDGPEEPRRGGGR